MKEDKLTNTEIKKENQDILNKYVDQKETAVLIHKPTNKSTSQPAIKTRFARKWAEESIKQFNSLPGNNAPESEFVLVEVRQGDIIKVRVSSLSENDQD